MIMTQGNNGAEMQFLASDELEMASGILGTLSDPMRLQMLWALCQGECTLSDLAQQCGVSTNVASQLMTRLRTAGVLRSHKDGRHVIYELHDDQLRDFIESVVDMARRRLRMELDDAS